MEWTMSPCIVESDCKELVALINSPILDSSANTFIIQDIKRLLAMRPNFQLIAIDRAQNQVSHVLANMGRVDGRTVTWLRLAPDIVMNLCLQEAVPEV